MAVFNGARIRVKIDVACLKQEKITFPYENMVYVYII